MEKNWKKNVAWFLSGQTISLFGSMLVQYAIMWHITLKTQSGSMMTLFVIVGMLPTFFISPFAGVWADRHNRKYLINGADSIIALASLLVAILFLAGFEQLWILFACATVRALGQGVQTPAVGAFIPQLVPEEHLTKVNGINASIQSCIMLVSPMASGALLTFASIEYLFFIDVITAAIGIGFVSFLVKVPSVPKTVETGESENSNAASYFHDLKKGFSYISKHKFILRLIILSGVFLFFAAPPAMLTPLQATRNFGAEVWRLTAIEITFSAGMLGGGLLMTLWGGFKNKIHTIILSCVFFGIESIVFGLVANFPVYLAVMVICGVTMPLYNTTSTVLIQTKVDPAYMGRVFSVFAMMSTICMPLGMLLFGPLADHISIDWILIGSGMVTVLLAIPFMANRELREGGKAPATSP
ncbi:MFS transporter [Treponema primitia]|uniref:MFS transporter n=1 Tax=Treponema primitia TaxID=88058 RepID=UPI00059F0C96|nr:MFS transporter [Treponema primitia]